MIVAARMVAIVVLGLLLWPELGRYRAEWLLADGNARLERVLRGATTGNDAMHMADAARNEAQRAAVVLVGDPRPILQQSIALLLQQRGTEAIALLTPAIAAGERPELTINLGRARGISGDSTGASAAFLRTAWISPAAIATLPKAMRGDLLDQVKSLEADLRNGRLTAAPPLG
ncbi:MAG: hypothetical protein ABI451_02105 [Dokdonella sp.]